MDFLASRSGRGYLHVHPCCLSLPEGQKVDQWLSLQIHPVLSAGECPGLLKIKYKIMDYSFFSSNNDYTTK